MRLSAAIALSLVLIVPMAFAQTAPAPAAAPPSPAATQLALKLYDQKHLESAFDLLMSSEVQNELAKAGNVAGPKGQACQAQLRPSMQAFVERARPILANLADGQFRQSAANVFATNMTEQELRDVTTFLDSPAGKKWSASETQLESQILDLAKQKAQPRGTQVQAAETDFEKSFITALKACPAEGAASPATQAPPPKKKK